MEHPEMASGTPLSMEEFQKMGSLGEHLVEEFYGLFGSEDAANETLHNLRKSYNRIVLSLHWMGTFDPLALEMIYDGLKRIRSLNPELTPLQAQISTAVQIFFHSDLCDLTESVKEKNYRTLCVFMMAILQALIEEQHKTFDWTGDMEQMLILLEMDGYGDII